MENQIPWLGLTFSAAQIKAYEYKLLFAIG